jgi:hypothetical protein
MRAEFLWCAGWLRAQAVILRCAMFTGIQGSIHHAASDLQVALGTSVSDGT